MKTNIASVLILSALAAGVTACDSDRFSAPGNYENESSAVDSNGTRVDRNTDTNVSVDANGKKHVVKKTTTSKDPKGLLNKSTNSSTTEKTYDTY